MLDIADSELLARLVRDTVLATLASAVPSKMSPFVENTYFFTPVPRYVVIGASSQAQLCTVNPQRVGLIIGQGNPSGAIEVSPDPTLVSALASVQHGIVLSGNANPLLLTQSDWGPLVTMEWWGASISAGTAQVATIIELILRVWPTRSNT
jgi:hypothetical protein